jgi:hypothetical protein
MLASGCLLSAIFVPHLAPRPLTGWWAQKKIRKGDLADFLVELAIPTDDSKISLRRHYPDQVRGFGVSLHAVSAGIIQRPITLSTVFLICGILSRVKPHTFDGLHFLKFHVKI